MAVSDDDVGVIPVSIAAPTHIPKPPAMCSVCPRLGYVSDAELVRCRNDLQRGSLLPWSHFMLLDNDVLVGTRSDVVVIRIGRGPAIVLVLVESVACGMSECSWYSFVAVEGNCDAHV